MNRHSAKKLVVALALAGAAVLFVSRRVLPYLAERATYTDGERIYTLDRGEGIRYAIWDEPQALGGGVNSPAREARPALAPDGRLLVFAVGELGENAELWMAEVVEGEPRDPRPLAGLNSPADDLAPSFGGGALYFASNRAGGQGGFDLYAATYDGFDFGPPAPVGGGINSPSDELDPAPLGTPGLAAHNGRFGLREALAFASNRAQGGRGDLDLFVAVAGGAEGRIDVAAFPGINSEFDEREPDFHSEGGALYFASDRGDGRDFDLYRSMQELEAWLAPEPLAGLNSADDERGPDLSAEGFELYFSRSRSASETVTAAGGGTGENAEGLPLAADPGDLHRARSTELFRRPPPPAGWLDLLLLAALLLLALLAWLAQRWEQLDILYKCLLISVLLHLLLMWLLRDVYPEGGEYELREVGGEATYLVRVLSDERTGGPGRARRTARGGLEPDARGAPRSGAHRPLGRGAGGPRGPAPGRTPRARGARARPGAEARAGRRTSRAGGNGAARARAGGRSGSSPRRSSPRCLRRRSRWPRSRSPLRAPPRTAAVDDAALPAERQVIAATRSEREAAIAPASPLRRRVTAPAAGEGSAPPPALDLEPTRAGAEAAPGPALAMPAERAPVALAGAAPVAPLPQPTEFGGGIASARAAASPRRAARARRGERERRPARPRAPRGLPRGPRARPAHGRRRSAPRILAPRPERRAERAAHDRGEPRAGRARARRSGGRARGARPGAVAGAARRALPGARPDPPSELGGPSAASAPVERRALAAVAPSEDIARPMPRAPAAPRPQGMSPLPDAPERRIETPYRSRFGTEKEVAIQTFGGGADTEHAVAEGLAYLARRQSTRGHWGDPRELHPKYRQVAVGNSALALLAFLGAGHTHRSGTEHSETVARAIEWLLSVQDERTGHFGNCDSYGHGIATYALAECFALTQDPAPGGPDRARRRPDPAEPDVRTKAATRARSAAGATTTPTGRSTTAGRGSRSAPGR